MYVCISIIYLYPFTPVHRHLGIPYLAIMNNATNKCFMLYSKIQLKNDQ